MSSKDEKNKKRHAENKSATERMFDFPQEDMDSLIKRTQEENASENSNEASRKPTARPGRGKRSTEQQPSYTQASVDTSSEKSMGELLNQKGASSKRSNASSNSSDTSKEQKKRQEPKERHVYHEALNVETEALPEMGRLLTEAEDTLNAASFSALVANIDNDNITLRLSDNSEIAVNRPDIRNNRVLAQGEHFLFHAYTPTNTDTQQVLEAVKPLPAASRRTSSQRSDKQEAQALRNRLTSRKFIIDGSNVCRGFLQEYACSSLRVLAQLAVTLLRNGADFRCVFDANERYVLAEHAPEASAVFYYDTLLRDVSTRFMEVSGLQKADELVLALADRENLPIITNDRYDKPQDGYVTEYPWLRAADNRLIQGKTEDGILIIKKLGIHEPVPNELTQIINELRNLT